MPTAPAFSRDPALEAHAFWHKHKSTVAILLVILLLAAIGFGAYQIYSGRQDATAATELAAAKSAQDYEQLIANYPATPAAASAHLLLAQAQRDKRMFAESNATLEAFVKKNRDSELIGTAELGIAANLESMGKMDEALAKYQKVAADYPKSYTAPLALFSQVPLLKAKKQTDAARRVCETILTQYRESMWASQAMMELRSLKPGDGSQPPSVSNKPPPPAISGRPPMRLPETGPPPAVPPPGPVPSAAKPPKRN